MAERPIDVLITGVGGGRERRVLVVTSGSSTKRAAFGGDGATRRRCSSRVNVERGILSRRQNAIAESPLASQFSNTLRDSATLRFPRLGLFVAASRSAAPVVFDFAGRRGGRCDGSGGGRARTTSVSPACLCQSQEYQARGPRYAARF